MLSGARFGRHRQRGLSLVELMVGITIGLIVVAAATLLVSGQITESRRLIAEAQMQQDIRASADIIVRELRRSGAIGQYGNLQPMVWSEGSSLEPQRNLLAGIFNVAGSGTEVSFNYYPDGPGTLVFSMGIRLQNGVVQTNIFSGGWQDLTDPAAMEVTALAITRVADSVSRLPCPRPCPSGDTACWPTVNQRTLEVSITARHRAFPEIERTHRSRVRLRNDHFVFSSAAPSEVCPS